MVTVKYFQKIDFRESDLYLRELFVYLFIYETGKTPLVNTCLYSQVWNKN